MSAQMDDYDLPVGVSEAPLGVWRYTTPAPTEIARDELTFATFNIWFDAYFAQQRYTAISRLLAAHQPDFIALQEVTSGALSLFLEQPWIRKAYYVSEIYGDALGDYGVVLLSRFLPRAVKLVPLPTLMNRHLLFMELHINGAPLHVATVHLESRKSSALMRRRQLETIFEVLENVPHVVIMGDFNFCASWDDENDHIDPAYHDVWTVLRGDEPGYTEDTTINRMRYLVKGKHKHVRFDRVLLKSAPHGAGWRPSSIELLGTKPIVPDQPDVFPSDHFGLLCRIAKRR